MLRSRTLRRPPLHWVVGGERTTESDLFPAPSLGGTPMADERQGMRRWGRARGAGPRPSGLAAPATSGRPCRPVRAREVRESGPDVPRIDRMPERASSARRDTCAMPNIDELDPLEVRDVPGFEARRGRLGWALGTERLGLSVWEIEPGQAAYPYHFHVQEEEVVVVLAGKPSVRSPD